jgi:hypothetical protein
MSPKIPRPLTLAGQRAGNSKGLDGTFDPQNTEQTGKLQDGADRLPQHGLSSVAAIHLSTFRTARCAAWNTHTAKFHCTGRVAIRYKHSLGKGATGRPIAFVRVQNVSRD